MNLFQKIKAALTLKSAFENIKEAYVKAGWKTTEFWLTVVGTLLTVWFAMVGMIDPNLAAKIIAVVTLVYSIARAVVKFTATPKDDEILARIEDLYNSKKQ